MKSPWMNLMMSCSKHINIQICYDSISEYWICYHYALTFGIFRRNSWGSIQKIPMRVYNLNYRISAKTIPIQNINGEQIEDNWFNLNLCIQNITKNYELSNWSFQFRPQHIIYFYMCTISMTERLQLKRLKVRSILTNEIFIRKWKRVVIMIEHKSRSKYTYLFTC